MRSYCDKFHFGCGIDGSAFIKQYSEYLAGVLNGRTDILDVYEDPDKTYCNRAEDSFYGSLVKFLRQKEESLESREKWEYALTKVEALKGEKKGYAVPPGIEVKCKGKPILYLRSDQFGFSAPNGNLITKLSSSWKPGTYPYARYLDLKIDKKSAVKTDDENIVKVATWVARTRTIGGSFIWPINRHEYESQIQWHSDYNMQRGASGYVQDRVDMTLLEVKHFYEFLSENGTFNKKNYAEKYNADILYGSELRRNKNMRIWLTHFGALEGFLKYFDLEDFVSEEYEVKNIITGEKLTEQSCADKNKCREEFQNLDIEKTEEMLDRLSLLIGRRSERMERDILAID